MFKSLTTIFAFLLGIVGEAVMARLAANLRLWWETQVSNEMKKLADDEYNRIFKDSQDLGNPNPPDEKNTPDTKGS